MDIAHAQASITLTLPDGSPRHFDRPVTVVEVAAAIGPGLARNTVTGQHVLPRDNTHRSSTAATADDMAATVP